ncbi:MgtC/SapB family protein [Limoniibacter endophyticus]|uniref:Protein MgtC n=1 Tax=Limoniibacter endophyticus TaxID=1565040 RepID=A0A8J3DNS6_9HYPH|nr:MgtC/SapB family protein [Limoniibacter endophyticus]GHC74925.1 membrane protein [Limoniibacter endophyticus]
MQEIWNDIIAPGVLPTSVQFARLLGAIVFGALIGFERQMHGRPAGLRTHILVCLAAATFAVLSIESVHMRGFEDQQVQIDPLRVIEAVTAGVAFLAAGMIIVSRGRVKGLTTGAGMWLSGGIGLAVGLGHWKTAIFGTIASIFILYVLGLIEPKKSSTEKDENPSD